MPSALRAAATSPDGQPLHGRTGPLLLAAALLLATALVGVELLVEGPFLWHASRTSSVAGWLEVLLLWGALTWVMRRHPGRWRVLLLLVPVALYLRRHHVDLPALVAVGYLEFLLALGLLCGRVVRAWQGPADATRWLEWLLFGVAAWSAALWGLQLAGYGALRSAAGVTAIAAVAVFAIARGPLLSATLVEHSLALPDRLKPAAAGAIAFSCALFARSNISAGHDGLWYGFRPEQVLLGGGSVFEPTGLVSPVYYFPKLYEVLVLPLSAFGDFSFVAGASIVLAVLVALLTLRLLRALGVPDWLAALAALGVLTTPALANVALVPKPDTLAALGVLAMVVHLHALARGEGAYQFGQLLGWAGVVALSKLNLLPYVAVLGCASLALLARRAQHGPGIAHSVPMLAVLTAAGAAVTARTWVLTGMPTVAPEQLVAIWRWLGMEMGPVAGTLDWVYPPELRDMPALALDWLLRPARLPHIVISWCGNAWFVLCLAALVAGGARRGLVREAWPEWLVALTGCVLLFAVRYHYRGSDGNYFIAPVACAWVVACALLVRRAPWLAHGRAVALALAAVAMFQGYYAFISGGWGIPGTRRPDLGFAHSVWDTPATRQDALRRAGLSRIGAYLDAAGNWHVVGDVPEPDGFWLKARYESLQSIGYSRPELLDSPEGARRLVGCGGIDALIVGQDRGLAGHALLAHLGAEAPVLARDDAFVLVDLRAMAKAAGCPGAAP